MFTYFLLSKFFLTLSDKQMNNDSTVTIEKFEICEKPILMTACLFIPGILNILFK